MVFYLDGWKQNFYDYADASPVWLQPDQKISETG
jgi:hypothetical protein